MPSDEKHKIEQPCFETPSIYTGLRGASPHSPDEIHLGGNIIEGDPYTFSPRVWNYLISRFAPRSIMDLGSGMGYAASYFFKRGLPVIAIEGMESNVKNAVFPTIKIDLTKTFVRASVDLVHCQEVVEHVDKQYVDNVLKSLANGKIIVMTNALPGQGGEGHVNEQPLEYWIENMARYGCHVLEEDTKRIRQFAEQDGARYLAKTGTVYANRNNLVPTVS